MFVIHECARLIRVRASVIRVCASVICVCVCVCVRVQTEDCTLRASNNDRIVGPAAENHGTAAPYYRFGA